MRNFFNKPVIPPLSDPERALKAWGVEYQKQPGGDLIVPGPLDLTGKNLARLPDLSSVVVRGNFFCGHNQLTSLEGAPQTVNGDFHCHSNNLTSLRGAPHIIGGGLFCSCNQLTSLEGAPQSICGEFWCLENHLTSLEHAPQDFNKLKSDFGEFVSWDAVPIEHRTSPETKARLEQDRLTAATVLQSAMRVRGPLKFRSTAFRA